MKEDIKEASQKEETVNQGKEDDNQGARDGTTMPAHMSVDVWYDVLQFITRKQIADRVSLACHVLNKLCWTHLHSKKVTPYMVERLSFHKGFEENGQTKAVLYKLDQTPTGSSVIPIATDIPVPNYIQGFKRILIWYLDSEVLRFIRNINPLLANLRLSLCRLNIDCTRHNLQSLLDALNGCPIASLHISSSITISISKLRQKLPGILENIPAITMSSLHNNDRIGVNELIMAKLEIGKSFVLNIRYWPLQYLPINKIQEAFQTAKQRQSFLIILDDGPGPEAFRLVNEETGEVLALEYIGNWKCELYRCPRGEARQWREEAKKLLNEETYTTHMTYYWWE